MHRGPYQRCKMIRQCYVDMLLDLHERDEAMCIEDVEVGTSTYLVYFKALQKYCSSVFNFTVDYTTSESRNLYEILVHMPKADHEKKGESIPIILLEAGQSGGLDAVRLSLSIIERLVACEENDHMIQNVRWIFLPCTNPDGLEYVRFGRPDWVKNTRKSKGGESYGVDILRNFDIHWNECEKVKSVLDPFYPGPSANSEIETKFIRNVLLKYKDDIKSYLSIRRVGQHGILYPHSFSDQSDDIDPRQIKVAEMISLKVNQRGGALQAFVNDSIYRINGKPVCGSSVDYAHAQGIQLPFELRVGFEKDMQILKSFQSVGKGHGAALRAAYFSGLRELHAIITNAKEVI
ncbi:zinc carboxypeptidase A 1-like isoform X2 [Leguminivora glycinivorella]|uniref:zinc carboxypeptidase A 1-like isoform X2 n=1 Tax=Leguminivora glycinivorella TaxID=1035111 RepID=UPI00201091CA|nr:zinc carboxypeptidase A 1-like isoform X2 [Leguminivora glycinivorella]